MGGIHPYFLEFPPIFSEAVGKIYIEKDGKRSTNVINSHFSKKNPLCFSNKHCFCYNCFCILNELKYIWVVKEVLGPWGMAWSHADNLW
jgi:hypothetical protein